MKEGDIVEIEGHHRKWVVLEVKQKHWDEGINAEHLGLHCFGGMWYGDDPMNPDSYGKILPLSDEDKLVGHVSDYDLETIKKMVN